ncbi:MAG TPA: molybdopterin-binding protein [Candidatus Bathyarchaeia archaeon]|jgi:molybdenum cofactor synthesis domain-containing protein|nr:molybdopterin-binding protein [Candidatus Bathyarchaeia archaeon]
MDRSLRKSPQAEILSIGNELLIGHTLDTNSHWIAKRLTRYGWTLQRITILRDSLAAIKVGVKEALQREPDLTITLGGLGPTHDDITLKGVALALRKRLVLNKTALAMVESRYRKLEAPTGLTSFRRKMATLPDGAQPLPNPVGTAPGVLVKAGATRLVSLPGVPSEMRAIFNSSIVPILKTSKKNQPGEVFIGLVGIIESALAPALNRTRKAFPGLYFKSHPRGREGGIRSLIQLHVYDVDSKSRSKIDNAIAFLLGELAKSGRQ